MHIKIYGHSDDVIETEINGECDEINALNNDKSKIARVLRVAMADEPKHEVLVVAIFGIGAGWCFAVTLPEEDELPPWEFRIEHGHEYSTALVIQTGADVVTIEPGRWHMNEWHADKPDEE